MPVNMETMVQQSCDFVGTPRLNLEEWAALLRSTCGGDHEVIDPNAFAGWMRRVSVYGVAARVLRQLVLDGIGDEESTAAPAGPHMRLALYDLLGALFAPSDPGPVSRHADRLFARILSVIKDRCADPDFGPAEVAAETGISLRYVHKLLTARGSTCNELIYSIRLDHAAHLLERRASLSTGQHLSEIADACGFRDYAHFARRFRHRFGHAPGAHFEGGGPIIGNWRVHAHAGEHSSSSAHNV